jgi:UDP-N-acetylglucosamine 2-epimerase
VRVVTVIGNRPQFVKAAAVSRLLGAEYDELLAHTGQHHDDELTTVGVEELGVARPERELVGDVMVDVALLFQPRAGR